MTSQHRATPEQWAEEEIWAADDTDSSCILELRARVEALEAAQKSAVPDAVKAQHLTWNKFRHRLLRDPTVAQAHAELESPSTKHPPAPADSLVERVARHVAALASDGLPGDDAKPTACAAIREIAAWLDALPQDYTASANYFADMLRDEANK